MMVGRRNLRNRCRGNKEGNKHRKQHEDNEGKHAKADGCNLRKGKKRSVSLKEELRDNNKPYYKITKHAMERFQERFGNDYKELDWDNRDVVRTKLLELVLEAQENNSFRNNHKFMDRIYDTYGYDTRFRFLCNGPITFVVVINPGHESVVTCFDGSHDRYVVKHKKFKKKKKREKNEEINIIDLEATKAMGWNIGLGHCNGGETE